MAIAADVQEVFSRLFDHRPFLKQEISFFKSEFEDKRGDREVEQLFRALELTTEIKQAQVEKVVEACDDHLPRTIADIEVALRMCQTALEYSPQQQTETLEKRRREREERRAAAEADIATKLTAVDRSYDLKEADLRKSYDKLIKESSSAVITNLK